MEEMNTPRHSDSSLSSDNADLERLKATAETNNNGEGRPDRSLTSVQIVISLYDDWYYR
jgi:hypothetical protein